MKPLSLTLLLLFLLVNISFCQTDSIEAKRQAEEMNTALAEGNYELFCNYVHPTIIKIIGKEKMIETVRTTVKDTVNGTAILESSSGEPYHFIRNGDTVQCILIGTITMKMPQGIFTQRSSQIGISYDKGGHWYFVSASPKKITAIKQIIPGISDEFSLLDEAPVKLKKRKD